MHTFSASGFLAQAARHGATHASLFAAPIRMILARGEDAGAARRPAALLVRDEHHATTSTTTLRSLFGCRPRQLYGMTETIPAVLTEPADRSASPGSMGRRSTDGVRSVEPTTATRSSSAGSPGITLFAGYLDDPATTAASFVPRTGWFLTGDRAHRDATGASSSTAAAPTC